MYRVRIPIGILLIAIVALLGYTDYKTNTAYATSSIMGLALVVALSEFYAMTKNRNYQPYTVYGLLSSLVMVAAMISHMLPIDLFAIVLSGVFIRFLFDVNKENALENCAITVLGLVYVYFLFSFVLKIRAIGGELQHNLDGLYYLVFLLFVAKSMDIGGYLVGKAFGKHKIVPGISPNKSYEGAIGGIILAIGVAYLFRENIEVIRSSLTLTHTIIFACLMAILSLLGDFCESLIKRRCDVKDSNQLIPEFGGILDLVDSLLLTAPIGYYYLVFFLTN
ncbi:phosphatidate cytidylyltransferase [Candidatus Uabimicrobium sp. HlEnr_7]|uniref:phosphatidate cytidylyltransferase n=1 Tax=Candidatus Uabimicrobium helgolandensis TaxID=3095367 RepID=UPI0035563669